METTRNSNTKDFTVAVIGGGVSGLALAIALSKKRIAVEVFEAASKFEQIGAGIGLGPNALRVLGHLGLLAPLLEKLGESQANFRSFKFMSGLGGHEFIYDYAQTSKIQGVGLHRAVYLEVMLPLLDMSKIHLNKRCTSVTPAPHDATRSIVHFADGTTHEADVIVGADGIKSAVRSAVIDDAIERVAFSNTEVYRALIPIEDLQAARVRDEFLKHALIFCGKDKHLTLYPVTIDGHTLLNFVGFTANYDIPIGSVHFASNQPTVVSAGRDEIFAAFEEWGADIIKIIKCLPAAVSKWYIHMVYPPLDTYVKGHIALVGDAAHAMLPHLGAGAGQGIEDMFVLSELLGHPQTAKANIEAVLRAYDRARRPRSQMVAHRSTENGRVYDSWGKPGVTVESTREKLKDTWRPVWEHDLVPDILGAVQWLEKTGAFYVSTKAKI